MIYVFTDGSGWQAFPEPKPDSRPYVTIAGPDEQRIRAGALYRIAGGIIEILSEAEAAAEIAEGALAAERAAMIVSRFQARAALHNAGLLTSAESAIASADTLAQLAWQDAQEFRRNSPTVAAIASTLGLTDTQLDDLFRQAATIEA